MITRTLLGTRTDLPRPATRTLRLALQILLMACWLSPEGVRAAEGETGVDKTFLYERTMSGEKELAPVNANGLVDAIAVQPDGKIVIGGVFTQVNDEPRVGIARLHADGSLDTGFAASVSGLPSDPGRWFAVQAIAIQSNGKLLIAGQFSKVNGEARYRIARLNANGTLDATFNYAPRPTAVAGDQIRAIAIQNDGKVIIGGSFGQLNFPDPIGVARLNSDGSLDTSFVPVIEGYSLVHSLALQPDGAILIGGEFTKVHGEPRHTLARLYSDGSLDRNFNPNIFTAQGSKVFTIALQQDGKSVIGGIFNFPTTFSGVRRDWAARLNSDGTLDENFDPIFDSYLTSTVVQSDGKILVGGQFTTINGVVRRSIGRLKTDGTLDESFDPGEGASGAPGTHHFNGNVWSVAVQQDGRVLIGGLFTSVDGEPYMRLARLNAPRNPSGDLLMKVGDEVFAGDNIYLQAPGGAQLRSDELAAGVPLKYTIKIQNDRAAGPSLAFRLRTEETAENLDWEFRLTSGQNDITAAAETAEGWKTPELAMGAEVVVTLEAKPKKPDADEAAAIHLFLSTDEEMPKVLDALGMEIERSDVIVVNQAADTDDPTPEDGSPDVDATVEGPQITLRSAINFSNRKPTRDTIEFNVEGSGIPLIKPGTALPEITAPTVLAGDTSSGKWVELDGSSAGEANGLSIQSEDCVVRGFVVHSFAKNGIEIGGTGMNRVEGCRIGTDPAGVTARTNRLSGIHITSPRNTIGAATDKAGTAPGNVISGNGHGNFNGINAGVFIEGTQADENVVAGNLIGTDATGTHVLRNEEYGVLIIEGSENRIGGTDGRERNIISGNYEFGVGVSGAGASKNRVVGNFIGTDLAGAVDLGNGIGGVVVGLAAETVIGGTASGSRNVIAGAGNLANTESAHGLVVLTGNANKSIVQGNYIGTDATGEKALGTQFGVAIAGAIDSLVGGYSPAARNVISGNLFAGVELGHDGKFSGFNQNNIVAGNFIGTDKSGTVALPNGTSSDGPRAGVLVAKGSGTFFLGSANATGRNVISGNLGPGVLVTGGGSDQRAIFANYIGTQPDGQGALPNEGPGIWVKGAVSNIFIGAIQNGFPNRIAFNQGPGVFVEEGTKILVFGNEIFRNTGLGIDLGAQGPTLNDYADADTGPNQLQNFPVLETVARLEDGSSRITGRLDARGAAGDSFGIAFYTSSAGHASGAGEGETFLGYALVPANPSGVIAFDVTIPKTITPGLLLTATATDINSNTSEFTVAGVVEGKVDSDADGISDDVENQVPNRASRSPQAARRNAAQAGGYGDGNGDGILDSHQKNVTSFLGMNGKWQTLVVPQGITLASVRVLQPSDFDSLPDGYIFEAGFLAVKITNVPPATPIAVTQIFHDGPKFNTVLAHGPTADEAQPHWYEFLFDGTTGAQLGSDEIVSYFVDGGRGDSDVQINSEISTLLAPATLPSSQLLNISTRMQVGTDPKQLIGGFIVTGTEPKKVIILATGPSLSAFGIPGVLVDPVLELYQGNTLIAANDNWKVPAQAEIEATGLQPTHDLEAALVRTLEPGAYTAIVRGSNGTGIGTVQVYDLAPAANSKLANISSRGFVEAADSGVMIAGFIVGGNGIADSRVVVRALGPSLGAFGIAGALSDPTLELKDANGTTLASNDDWPQSPEAVEINGRGLAPGDTREPALVALLPKASFTAIVRGKNGETGVGVVEVYHVD